MIVEKQIFPLLNHSETRLDLYPHQAVMLDEWDKNKTFLLVTKTGTGKTIGAVMPLLKRRQRAILVYPTNELIRDQVSSIGQIGEMEGLKACVLTPETPKEVFARADVILVHIDAAALAAWDKTLHLGGKWAALKYLLAADKPVKPILTNPDILFLIFALRYRAEPLAALQAYKNLIIDEFHLYQGVEFAHALFMIHLARRIVDRVAEDPAADPTVVARVQETLEDIVRSYARLLDMERVCEGILGQFEKAQKGIQLYQWMKVYENLNIFRTSMPSEMVCDFAEKERRGTEWDKAKYSVDMTTLLRRAEGLRFNEKIPHPDGGLGMLTVKGYGRYKKVWVMPTFEDEDCGVFRVSSDHPDLCFMQEGHKTSVSHLMTFRPHIFALVPKTVAEEIDWRLPVFECGRHLIAFDGAALLLNELWGRQKER